MILAILALGCFDYGIEDIDQQVEIPEDPVTAPAIRVEPEVLDLGEVAAGETASGVITVANDGDAPLAVDEVVLDDHFGAFAITDLGPGDLDPGEARELVVTLEPVYQRGEVEAEVRVHSSDPAHPTREVALLGRVSLPELVLEPVHHDFGELARGESAQVELVVRNDGGSWGTVRASTWASSSPGELDLVQDIDAPVVLYPGDERTLIAAYAPEDRGRDEASLVLATDDPAAPELAATLEGTGSTSEYALEMLLTADDEWRAWVDGTEHTGSSYSSWSYHDTLAATLESGDHVIAVHAYDVARVISGFIAVVWVDGVAWSVTGDGSWVMVDASPGSGWEDVAFDDSSWSTAVPCADASTWGTYWPADFYAEGAQWVWNQGNCRALGETWFRLEMTLP